MERPSDVVAALTTLREALSAGPDQLAASDAVLELELEAHELRASLKTTAIALIHARRALASTEARLSYASAVNDRLAALLEAAPLALSPPLVQRPESQRRSAASALLSGELPRFATAAVILAAALCSPGGTLIDERALCASSRSGGAPLAAALLRNALLSPPGGAEFEGDMAAPSSRLYGAALAMTGLGLAAAALLLLLGGLRACSRVLERCSRIDGLAALDSPLLAKESRQQLAAAASRAASCSGRLLAACRSSGALRGAAAAAAAAAVFACAIGAAARASQWAGMTRPSCGSGSSGSGILWALHPSSLALGACAAHAALSSFAARCGAGSAESGARAEEGALAAAASGEGTAGMSGAVAATLHASHAVVSLLRSALAPLARALLALLSMHGAARMRAGAAPLWTWAALVDALCATSPQLAALGGDAADLPEAAAAPPLSRLAAPLCILALTLLFVGAALDAWVAYRCADAARIAHSRALARAAASTRVRAALAPHEAVSSERGASPQTDAAASPPSAASNGGCGEAKSHRLSADGAGGEAQSQLELALCAADLRQALLARSSALVAAASFLLLTAASVGLVAAAARSLAPARSTIQTAVIAGLAHPLTLAAALLSDSALRA